MSWYNYDKCINKRFVGYKFAESEPDLERIDITWGNLNDVYHEYGLTAPFIISNIFGTTCIEFFDGCLINWFNPKELKRIYKRKLLNFTCTLK